MNSLKTVLFPATVIHSIRQYPIFLLFPQIQLIAPVESSSENQAGEPTDTFINSGLCQVDTPCPLGENLSRFQHLIKDIRNRKDDYAAQLSSLTLAAMSSSASSGEESEQAIINEFLTPKDLTVEEEKQNHEAKLWQARLVLAIGEVLDAEEEEIARNLSLVDDDTAGLFNALKGELDDFDQDSPFAELSQLKSNFSGAHSGNMSKRLNSWAQLFSESSYTDSDLFITTSADVIDILSESYDALEGLAPIQHTGFELPSLIGWSEKEALESVQAFKQTNETLLADLVTLMADLIEDKQGGLDKQNTWDDIRSLWNTQLEQSFPSKELGRQPVTLYMYKNIDVKSLLGIEASKDPSKNTAVLLVG
ncbi:hypothetical protein [Desulforhopalus sp. 52FAK]